MDIPRADDRGDGDINMYAAGQCQTCGMAKMSMDGVRKCPRCDTKSTTKSGLVNRVKSVPKSAFTTVKKIGADGKEYEELVMKSKAEIQGMVGMEADVVPMKTGVTHQPAVLGDPSGSLASVYLYFEAAPAKSLIEFKKIAKIRKAIQRLRTQIEEYMGGK